MTRAEFAPVLGLLLSQQGQFGTFTVIPTDLAVPQGSWSGAPTAFGGHLPGAMTVFIGGFTASTAGVVKAGDLLKFAGHEKVYMAVADSGSNGTGLASIQLNTPLVGTVADTEAVVFNNVPITVALDGDVQSYAVGRGGFYQFDFDATEAV
ncbi:MAG: hypothetical protein ACE5FN_12305 [Leptospirillia bacterium]